MRQQTRAWYGWLVLTGALGGLASAAPPAEEVPAAVVKVILRPRVAVEHPILRIGDIAFLEDGSAIVRRQIAALDLLPLNQHRHAFTISREHVLFRIQIAGIDPQRFRVEGAHQVVVSPEPAPEAGSEGPTAAGGPAAAGIQQVSLVQSTWTEEALVAAARQQLLKHLPWPAEDVRIELAQPVRLPAVSLAADEVPQLQAELPSTSNLVGSVRVDVAVLVKGTRRDVVPVVFDVKVLQEVAVAKRRLEAGEMLTAANVQADRRPVSSNQSYPTYQECLAGAQVRRVLLPGQVIQRADLAPSATAAPVVVRARDLVKIMARVGHLRVTAVGEALQDGRPGQRIRVRNVDSKANIHARVVDRGTVEIDY